MISCLSPGRATVTGGSLCSEGRVHVIRTGENPHNPTIYSVNARKLYRGDPSQNMVLEQGDVVHVGREVLADVNHVIQASSTSTRLRPTPIPHGTWQTQ